MAGDRRKKRKLASQPRTPSKAKLPEKPIIGSGSTWTQKELDLYQVQCREGNVNVNTLIPEKWFTIEKPTTFAAGISLSVLLMSSTGSIMFDFS
jgi:hypothetical protein